jgi:hypothetical protein
MAVIGAYKDRAVAVLVNRLGGLVAAIVTDLFRRLKLWMGAHLAMLAFWAYVALGLEFLYLVKETTTLAHVLVLTWRRRRWPQEI